MMEWCPHSLRGLSGWEGANLNLEYDDYLSYVMYINVITIIILCM